MTDTVIINCTCGEHYLVASDKLTDGSFRCASCGEQLKAPEQDRNEAPDHRGPRLVVTQDKNIRQPDELMSEVGRSILSKTLVISFVAHVALLGLTSFSLYSDWAEFGLMMPHEIKEVKKERRIEEDEARRQAEREQRVAEERERIAAREEARERQAARADADTVGDERVPAVVEEATEVSDDRPAAPDFSLDRAIDLLD